MGINKKLLVGILKIIGIGLVCYLGLQLRLNYYSEVPRPGESLDEYANAWSGLGLIELGVPIGWSYMESSIYLPKQYYINVDNVYQNGTAFANPFYIHAPWLDHPPGMGLLTGGFAYIKGARVLEDASTVLIRKPMVYLGSLNVLLLGVLGWLYFNYKTGLMAAIIYAVSPMIVVANRLPQAENGFVPLFLLSTILIRLFQKSGRLIYLFLSALLAGAGVWFKVPGLMIGLSGGLILLLSGTGSIEKKGKLSLLFMLVAFSFGLTPLLAYGLALDPQAFFQILFFHSRRFYGIGVAALYNLFTQSRITNFFSLTDGWVIFGWISWLLLISKIKNKDQRAVIGIPLLVSVIFFIFLGSEFYGWYVFPCLPWLALSIGVMFNYLEEKRRVAPLAILVTLPVQILLTKPGVEKMLPNLTNYWRFLFPLYLFFVLVAYFGESRWMQVCQKGWVYLWFVLGVGLSVWYSLNLGPGVWLSVN